MSSILNHPLIGTRYFFPRKEHFSDPCWVPISSGRLSCWRSAPPSDRPILVHFHGNGEVVSDWSGPFAQWIQSRGVDVFLVEYRGYAMSDGEPALTAMLDDVSAVVSATGVPPSQLIAFGRSIGSLYATEMVRRYPEVRGLIIESGIHDLAERILLRVTLEELGVSRDEFDADVRTHFDQGAKIQGFAGQSLFLHAEQDHLVGIHHAVDNHGFARPGFSELLRLPFGDHNTILGANLQTYLTALAEFFQELERSSPSP